MKASKKKRLKSAGWEVGSAQEFLGLSAEESELIEIKLALARSLKKRRLLRRLTQHQLADRMGSSQSRIAKMEAADATVSIDLLVRSLLVLGVNRREVGRIMGRKPAVPAA